MNNNNFMNLEGVNVVMGRIETGQGPATIRTDKDHYRVSVTLDNTNQVLLYTEGDNLFVNEYSKSNPDYVVTNVTNMNGNETNECGIIIRTVSKKTGKTLQLYQKLYIWTGY